MVLTRTSQQSENTTRIALDSFNGGWHEGKQKWEVAIATCPTCCRRSEMKTHLLPLSIFNAMAHADIEACATTQRIVLSSQIP